MALIEGIGDDVMTLLFVTFIVLIVIMSWLSTNVREIMVPANLLVIERRSRRLYTANFNGAAAGSSGNSSRLSPSLTTTTTTSTNEATDISSASGGLETSGQSSSVVVSSSTTFEPARRRSNELELVNEIVEQALVEQALVDNLLEGGFYSTEEIDLITTSNNSDPATTAAESPIASGSGEVIASVRSTFR